MSFTVVLVSFCVILGGLLVFFITKQKEKKVEKDITKIADDIFRESHYVKDSLSLLGGFNESQEVASKLKINNQQLLEEKKKRRAYIMGYPGILIVCNYIIAHNKQLKEKYDKINKLVIAEIEARNKKFMKLKGDKKEKISSKTGKKQG